MPRLIEALSYRSCEVNELGNRNRHNCARNESNYAGHHSSLYQNLLWERPPGRD